VTAALRTNGVAICVQYAFILALIVGSTDASILFSSQPPAASLVIVDDNVQSPGVAPIDHLLDLGHVGGDLVGSLVGVTVPGAGA
jgi:hypothetical protein